MDDVIHALWRFELCTCDAHHLEHKKVLDDVNHKGFPYLSSDDLIIE